MYKCPYCTGTNLGKVIGELDRKRPDNQSVLRCSNCAGHVLEHANGKLYPLTDRNDPNADACQRVTG